MRDIRYTSIYNTNWAVTCVQLNTGKIRLTIYKECLSHDSFAVQLDNTNQWWYHFIYPSSQSKYLSGVEWANERNQARLLHRIVDRTESISIDEFMSEFISQYTFDEEVTYTLNKMYDEAHQYMHPIICQTYPEYQDAECRVGAYYIYIPTNIVKTQQTIRSKVTPFSG